MRKIDYHDTVENVSKVVLSIHDELPETKIFLIEVPPIIINEDNNEEINNIVSQLNTRYSKLADSLQYVDYLDVFPSEMGTKYYASDGIHLNSNGYSLLVTEIIESMSNIHN